MAKETIKLCPRCVALAAEGYALTRARTPEKAGICGLCRRRMPCGEYFAVPRKAAREEGQHESQS